MGEPPLSVMLWELECDILDVWITKNTPKVSRFAISRIPGRAGNDRTRGHTGIAYVDFWSDAWGPLLTSSSAEWLSPPYRFPALFFVPLNSGEAMWIRVEHADEIHLLRRTFDGRNPVYEHFVAIRVAPRRRETAPARPADVVVVSLLSLTMFHCFSDGSSFLPIAQDLFTFYEAARMGRAASLPPITD